MALLLISDLLRFVKQAPKVNADHSADESFASYGERVEHA
jgi:hypothetical protein